MLFCVYLDELLQRLHESGVSCYIGSVFVGALAYYADDIALLAPTPSAMRRLLKYVTVLEQSFRLLSTRLSQHVYLCPGASIVSMAVCSL